MQSKCKVQMTRLCVHYNHVNSDFIIQALAQTLANETSEDRPLPEDTLPNHFLSSIEELRADIDPVEEASNLFSHKTAPRAQSSPRALTATDPIDTVVHLTGISKRAAHYNSPRGSAFRDLNQYGSPTPSPPPGIQPASTGFVYNYTLSDVPPTGWNRPPPVRPASRALSVQTTARLSPVSVQGARELPLRPTISNKGLSEASAMTGFEVPPSGLSKVTSYLVSRFGRIQSDDDHLGAQRMLWEMRARRNKGLARASTVADKLERVHSSMEHLMETCTQMLKETQGLVRQSYCEQSDDDFLVERIMDYSARRFRGEVPEPLIGQPTSEVCHSDPGPSKPRPISRIHG